MNDKQMINEGIIKALLKSKTIYSFELIYSHVLEKFEGMTSKMINERIIKALLKNKIIYSFGLIYSHGLVSGITSLSIFYWSDPETLTSRTSQIFGFEKMLKLFLSRNMCSFFTNGVCKL